MSTKITAITNEQSTANNQLMNTLLTTQNERSLYTKMKYFIGLNAATMGLMQVFALGREWDQLILMAAFCT